MKEIQLIQIKKHFKCSWCRCEYTTDEYHVPEIWNGGEATDSCPNCKRKTYFYVGLEREDLITKF